MKNFILWAGTGKQKVLAYVLLIVGFSGGFFGSAVYSAMTQVQVVDIDDLVPVAPKPKPKPTTPAPSQSPTPEPEVTLPSSDGTLNFLVLGSDERPDGDTIEGMRADVTMIVNINEDNSQITAISIPRDSWVTAPSCTRSDGTVTKPFTGKFNHAFSIGGANGDIGSAAACTITAVQELTGISIDGVAVVDMGGFEGIVDTLGGVEMTLTEPIVSPKANLDLPAGKQMLNGKEALGYVRARKGPGLDGSDISRIGRQQELFASLAKATMQKVKNPVLALQLANTASSMLTVSPELRPDKLAGLAWDNRNAKIEFLKLPIHDRGDRANVLWSPGAYPIFEAFEDGSISQFSE